MNVTCCDYNKENGLKTHLSHKFYNFVNKINQFATLVSDLLLYEAKIRQLDAIDKHELHCGTIRNVSGKQ